MKEILFNLALIDANNFCKANNIDYSDTRLVKHARGFAYDLIKGGANKKLVTVIFNKSSVPTHVVHNY